MPCEERQEGKREDVRMVEERRLSKMNFFFYYFVCFLETSFLCVTTLAVLELVL